MNISISAKLVHFEIYIIQSQWAQRNNMTHIYYEDDSEITERYCDFIAKKEAVHFVK